MRKKSENSENVEKLSVSDGCVPVKICRKCVVLPIRIFRLTARLRIATLPNAKGPALW